MKLGGMFTPLTVQIRFCRLSTTMKRYEQQYQIQLHILACFGNLKQFMSVCRLLDSEHFMLCDLFAQIAAASSSFMFGLDS